MEGALEQKPVSSLRIIEPSIANLVGGRGQSARGLYRVHQFTKAKAKVLFLL